MQFDKEKNLGIINDEIAKWLKSNKILEGKKFVFT